jgi:MoaA/NifB/PqqE/SkfB family radical SAM enzyme
MIARSKIVRAPSIVQNSRTKYFRSEVYNYTFDLRSGHFRRWGRNPEDNPIFSPYGPEILDIEISSGGGCPISCAFCYKGNGKQGNGIHMAFSTFKSIFDKLPHAISKDRKNRIFFATQIAFGITSITSHPELWEIFDYCRENGVIPNVTVNGAEFISDAFLQRLVDTCGAIAISVSPFIVERAFGLVKRMTDLGAPQINLHYVVSEQSVDFIYDTLLPAVKTDNRLKRLNAVVFLGLKPLKGGANYDILPSTEYLRLVKYLLAKQINFGFDSCSCGKFIRATELIEMSPNQRKEISDKSEKCESGKFSGYIDVNGKYWHCSFGENREKGGGIDLLKVNDFIKEVWLSDSVKKWRCELYQLNGECPLFEEIHAIVKDNSTETVIATTA